MKTGTTRCSNDDVLKGKLTQYGETQKRERIGKSKKGQARKEKGQRETDEGR